jgi:enoyl-CoA hydratase/carnithine racemase
LLSGRVFTSDEAGEMGLVNAVVAPDQLMSHTLAYASDLAQNCSPTSWAVMKKQLYGDHAVSADEATSRSLPLMDASLKRADFQEGVQSYLDKRPPNFAPFSG